MPTATVSVVIPSYNAAEYLDDAIKSVVAQTLKTWELLIVDDGSTDATIDVVQPYLVDPRVRYVRIPNGGVSAARNLGITRTSAEFLAFLDSDDAWAPTNLERKIKLLQDNHDVDWVYSDLFLADQNLVRTGIRTAEEGDLVAKILRWEGDVIPAPPSNVVMRRSCFDSDLKWDTELSTAADQDLTIQLARRHRCQRIAEPLLTYRVRENSMSRSAQLTEQDHIRVFQKARANGDLSGTLFSRKCFANLFLIIAGTWWVNGRNRPRAILFILKAIWQYPPIIERILRKVLGRLGWPTAVRSSS